MLGFEVLILRYLDSCFSCSQSCLLSCIYTSTTKVDPKNIMFNNDQDMTSPFLLTVSHLQVPGLNLQQVRHFLPECCPMDHRKSAILTSGEHALE